jgi:hypothetical protein
MLIEVDNNLFINAKNISYAMLSKNNLEFTELGNDNLRNIKISDEGEKELREFFKFDENFIERLPRLGETQYINIGAISKISINENGEDDDVGLNIYFVNDGHPWSNIIRKEKAVEIINEIRKKIEKTKYVEHF